MNIFLKKVLLFLLPIIALAIGWEVMLRNIPNDYEYKKAYLEKNADSIEVLFLGSSHGYYGINPLFLKKKGFNAGQVSQSVNYDYKILEKYFSNAKKLETIVLPISYFTFHYNLENGDEAWRVKNYSIYHQMHTTNRIEDYSEVLSSTIKNNILRTYSYYLQKKPELLCNEQGFGLNNNSTKNRDLNITGPATAIQHTYKDSVNFEGNYQALLSIIAFAEKRNIQVLLFTPPAYETYIQNLDKKQLEKALATVQEIDKRFDNTVYVNLMQDKSFVAPDYFDADHMNEIGAEKLTKKIDSILLDMENYQRTARALNNALQHN